MRKILEKLGLSKYKIDTYLTLLKLKTATAIQISKKSSIPSSKIYETLNYLCENGFISTISQKPLTYRANNPKNILKSKVEDQMQNLKELKEDINNIKTDISTIQTGTFNIIQGSQAYFNKVKEVSSTSQKSTYAIIKNWKVDHELLEIENNNDNVKRFFLGPINKVNKQKVKERINRKAKVKNYNSDTTRFAVWDEKIVAISLKEQKERISLWIEDEELAKIMVSYFKNLWKKAQSIHSN